MEKLRVPVPRMTTGIERVFRRVSQPGTVPEIYREYMLHFIHYLDTDGTKLSTKLDKSIPGSYYREAKDGERARYGEEYTYTFPDGVTRRIIAIR